MFNKIVKIENPNVKLINKHPKSKVMGIELYKTFKYINIIGNSLSEARNIEDCIEGVHTRDSIDKLFVTKNDYDHKYYIFNNVESYKSHISTLDENYRCFHEVIFEWQHQRLKFDLDIKLEALNEFKITDDMDFDDINDDIVNINKNKMDIITDEIITSIIYTFYYKYSISLSAKDIVITDSTGYDKRENKTIFSAHIIIANYSVECSKEAKAFTYEMLKVLPKKYHIFVDSGINKTIQNFRLVNCQKYNSGRIQKIISFKLLDILHTFEDTIITKCANCQLLPSIISNETNVQRDIKYNIKDDEVENILKIAKPYTDGHVLRFQKGNLFMFDRQKPTYCDFCKRLHENDNTLMLTISNINGVCTIFLRCRRANEETPVGIKKPFKIIGDYLSSVHINVENKDINTVKIDNWKEKILTTTINKFNDKDYVSKCENLFDTLPESQKNIYELNTLKDFELKRTLCVKAMMKMGKTKKLENYIKNYFPTNLIEPVIRFISFRQTFSANIKEKFEDFTLYSDVKGKLNQNKLIIQVESLPRLDISQGIQIPDLLILDECESIFEQFTSPYLSRFNEGFAAFKWLIKYSKYVVCMDANISDRTFRILNRFRVENYEEAEYKIFYHCNKYKNATEDIYNITTDKLLWLANLYHYIELGNKIAVPISSLTEAEALSKNIAKKVLIGKDGQKYSPKVNIYSSKTSQEDKRQHFNDVDKYWSQYDVLIYTPTVSAGVSFEKPHFDKVFGYFIDMSCNVETCHQMIGRIRNVKDKQYYICLNAIGNNLPTKICDIVKFIHESRYNLHKIIPDNPKSYLQFDYDVEGSVKLYKSDYFQLFVENLRIKNISINNFVKVFTNYLEIYGCKMQFLKLPDNLKDKNPTDLATHMEKIHNEHSTIKCEIKNIETKCLINAKDISEEEAYSIQDKKAKQLDITHEEDFKIKKYILRKDYKWDGEIDKTFIKKYYKYSIRHIYKNLSKLRSSGATIEDSIKNIQSDEREAYNFAMDSTIKYRSADVNKKYMFEKHRLCIGLINICGFSGPFDSKVKYMDITNNRLKKYRKNIIDNFDKLSMQFSIRKPNAIDFYQYTDDQYLIKILTFINKIINIMYGCRIKFHKVNESYYISPCNLFTLNDKDHSLPYIYNIDDVTDIIFDDELNNEIVFIDESPEIIQDIDALI